MEDFITLEQRRTVVYSEDIWLHDKAYNSAFVFLIFLSSRDKFSTDQRLGMTTRDYISKRHEVPTHPPSFPHLPGIGRSMTEIRQSAPSQRPGGNKTVRMGVPRAARAASRSRMLQPLWWGHEKTHPGHLSSSCWHVSKGKIRYSFKF